MKYNILLYLLQIMRFSVIIILTISIISCNELESNQFEIKNIDSQPLHSESFENIAIPDLEINRIRSYFESFVGKRKFNGHIIVAKSGKIVFDTTSGFANIRKKIKLNKNSVIQLASITKPITATVILQLLIGRASCRERV